MRSKILLIDDEGFFTQQTSLILENKGYDVMVASNGLDGIQKAKSEDIDLILLDLMLPGMNGYQICSLIKQDDNFHHIPIIIFTAHDSENVRELSTKCNADYFYTKPVDIISLLQKMEELIKLKDQSTN
ncbi:MAG: response regulator [Candidatus Neomarinimicrobiota bacterium]